MSHTGPRPPLLSRYCFLLQKAPDRRQLANFTLKPPSNKTPSTRQDCLGRRSSHAQTAFKAFQPHFSSNCSAAASNRMDSCMQHQQACDLDLSLDGLEATLPSVDEQTRKRRKALEHLHQFIGACGGTLPEGWDCSMRFRITSRRHGRKGLTTDNYYYSPCGKTFRTHKQVAEFLGLQPAPKQQQQEQLLQNELPESFNILSVTVLDSGCSPSSSAASSEDLSGKRAHSAMTSTDTAQNCNRTGQLHAQQQHAVSAPAALGSSMSQGVSSVSEGSQLPSAKRTKAALAAKYTGSCSGSGVLSAPAAAAFSLPSTFSTATEADSCITGAESERACRAAPAMQQHASQLLMSAPAQPAASSTACSKPSSSEVAVSSRLFVKPAAVQEPQRRRQAVQQVPKWKPRQPAAWRAKLRELANQAAAEQGLLS